MSHSQTPVIAIAGLSIETSTFSPARTQTPAAFHPLRGNQIIEEYPFLNPGTPLGDAANWQGALIGHALPGGMVLRSVFEELAAEIIDRLKQLVASTTVHGLWFDIHGAMCVEGMDDVEVELLNRIQSVLGRKVLVSASMDLHGNVSRRLVEQTDLITCFRMAPHEDELETKERACRNLIDLWSDINDGGGVPLKAWIPLPILLPGEQTSTRIEPARSLYSKVPQVEAEDGVIDASVWVGYAWADEPRNRAAVVVTGHDRKAVTMGAESLARHFWTVRGLFHFVATTGSLDECVNAALSSRSRPFFISDSGDNPTAGGSGDVTWSLIRLLERPEFYQSEAEPKVYASIPGPEAIETILKAGQGATVTVTAGAAVDNTHSGPVTLNGKVHAIKHGDRDAEVEAVVQVGSLYVIVTRYRKPYHREKDFNELQLYARQARVVVVKIGYLEPELYDMAEDWMLGLTPGGVDQDLIRLGHNRIERPMFPFDREFNEPDLRARII